MSNSIDNKNKISKLNIELKATNPDNVFDIRGIIDLFNIAYGSTFPNHEVYMEDFWRERIGNRFISIIAERNSKIIGHIACCPHKDDPQNVQIIMPVVIPCQDEQEILNMMWNLVEDLAKKKSWKMAYKFIASYPEKMENTISMIGNFTDSAIYPGHKENTDNESFSQDTDNNEIHSQTSYPILYSQHTFNSQLIKNEIFYAPATYQEIIKNFYRELQIPRKLGDDKNKKVFKLYSDMKAIEIKSYKHTGLCRAYITPSLLTNFSEEALQYDANRFSDVLYYVNLLDPRCPEFCDFIESSGYSFCGIIPLIDNGDYIIYSKNIDNLKKFHFTKEDSENLREIILENENISNCANYKKTYNKRVLHQSTNLA